MNSAKEEPWITDLACELSEVNCDNAFQIDDASSVFHYVPIARLDRLNSNLTAEHYNECRVSNGLLCEEEITDLTLAACFPNLSQYHILDEDFQKKVSDLDFKNFNDEEFSFGNSRSTIKSNKCSVVISTQYINISSDEHNTQSDEVNQVIQLTGENYFSTRISSEEKMTKSRPKRLCRPPKKYAQYTDVMSQKKSHVKSSKRKADLDTDYNPKAPCSETKKGYNPWSLNEVVILLDGIARFGIGQWTAIWKTCFTSSDRNPTDIRDKWRNLVATNCGSSKIPRKGRRYANALPDRIRERVKELANLGSKV